MVIYEEESGKEYDEEVRVEDAPFPFTSVAVVTGVVVVIGKVLVSKSIMYLGLISLLGPLEFGSWIGVTIGTGVVDDDKGRELLAYDDTYIIVVFVLLMCILIAHVVINITFVAVYYK